MTEAMDISIYTYAKDAASILEGVKTYFSQQFPAEKLAWKESGNDLKISLTVSEEEITRVFEELVKQYPELGVNASFSYDVREGDTSAQWWGTTRIYAEKEDGEIKIVSSSSTYWN